MMAARWLVLGLALGLAGCAANKLHREGIALTREGQMEAGVYKLAQAAQDEPGNAELRKDFHLQRDAWIEQLLSAARNAQAEGRRAEAQALFQAG